MKNFLKTLAINPTVEVSLTLRAITDNGAPDLKVSVNNQIIEHKSFDERVKHEFSIPLLDPINILIEMSNKQYNEHLETAVILESVCIEGFEIIPNWTHLADYINERDINKPVSHLGYNGIWKLSINEPFYRWHHQITGQGWLLAPASWRDS